jgi:hypothetical protein
MRHSDTLSKMPASPFTPAERAIFRRLTTPLRIQRFIDELTYNKEPHGHTCRSPRRVLRDRTAHCMEGALFAAAALRLLGHPPLLCDLEAVRDDDHVLALFRVRGHWGAIAKSNYSGLRFREPVYRNLRELAISYFEHYYNPRGEKTLRAYSRPVDLRRFDRIPWMTTERTFGRFPSASASSPTGHWSTPRRFARSAAWIGGSTTQAGWARWKAKASCRIPRAPHHPPYRTDPSIGSGRQTGKPGASSSDHVRTRAGELSTMAKELRVTVGHFHA